MIEKIRQGLDVEGPAFIHVDASCTRGQRFDPALSIEMTRLVVQTCIHPLYRVVNGEYIMDRPSLRIAKDPSKKKPIEDFLKAQGRFRHLYKPEERRDLINLFQEDVDKRWEELKQKCGV